MRATDCLKCNFPRNEPKGARVCKNCGRVEGQAKGIAARYNVVAQTGVKAADMGQLVGEAHPPVLTIADFMDDPPSPTDALSNTAAPSVTSEGASVAPAAAISSGDGHSRLGGSSAKRFLNCPGSVRLIASLPDIEEDDEFSAPGTQAHACAARCLEEDKDAWEVIAEYPLLNPQDAGKLQTYLDYVRGRPGRRRFEIKYHQPKLHPQMYGTIDAELIPMLGDIVLEIVDLKWGVGVYVPVEANEQLMYYAALVIYEDESFYPEDGIVRLSIAQPRVPWVTEPVRSWETTVGHIKAWVQEVLIPGMVAAASMADPPLVTGEWCQFCPAKLYCPAQKTALVEFEQRQDLAILADKLPAITNDELGALYQKVEIVRMLCKAIEAETFKRLMDRQEVPGAQLELGKSDRAWKEGADAAAIEAFGDEAWEERKVKSPARMEKLPHGDVFVATWAYKPEAGFKVCRAGRGKPAVQKPTATEVWANVPLDGTA